MSQPRLTAVPAHQGGRSPARLLTDLVRAPANGFAVLLRGNLVPLSGRCKAPALYDNLEPRTAATAC